MIKAWIKNANAYIKVKGDAFEKATEMLTLVHFIADNYCSDYNKQFGEFIKDVENTRAAYDRLKKSSYTNE